MTHRTKTFPEREPLSAFVTAHALYKNALCSYAFYKTHDPALTEDLVQDTFIKTWNYLVKHGQVNSMKAFLYHVLKQLIIDQYRRSKSVSLDALGEKGFDPPSHAYTRLPDMFDGRKAAELIDQLPERYRTIIYMRFLQDLSVKEIAEITGQSCNTVTVQSHRGLARLRDLYRAQ